MLPICISIFWSLDHRLAHVASNLINDLFLSVIKFCFLWVFFSSLGLWSIMCNFYQLMLLDGPVFPAFDEKKFLQSYTHVYGGTCCGHPGRQQFTISYSRGKALTFIKA